MRQAPHFGPTSTTRGHSTAAREVLHDTINANNNSNMADRNILPDHFKVHHYGIVLTDLDFAKWIYNGSVTYAQLPLVAPQA